VPGRLAGVHSPFLRPDAIGHGNAVADAAICLLAETGVSGLTSRAIASRLRVTPSALSQQGGRENLLRLVFFLFADRWENWVDIPPWHDLPARIPESEEEMHGVRVWQALAELARGEALAGKTVLSDVLRDAQENERASIARHLQRLLDRPPSPAEVSTTVALVVGLRIEIVAAQPAISSAQALELLQAHVERLRAGPGPAQAGPTPAQSVRSA
jgi:AcrR family transcriptional regulator